MRAAVAGRFDIAHAALAGVGVTASAMAVLRGLPPAEALAIGTAAGALAGFATDRLALWPFRLRSTALGENGPLIASAALLVLLAASLGDAGSSAQVTRTALLHAIHRTVPHFDSAWAPWIGGGVCLLWLIAGQALARSTRIGSAARALASGELAARAAGVDPEWAIALTTIVASLSAAAAGIVLAGLYAWPSGGVLAIATSTLAACAIGGVDAPLGALLAGYALAAAQVTANASRVPSASMLPLTAAVLICAVVLPDRVLAAIALRPAQPSR